MVPTNDTRRRSVQPYERWGKAVQGPFICDCDNYVQRYSCVACCSVNSVSWCSAGDKCRHLAGDILWKQSAVIFSRYFASVPTKWAQYATLLEACHIKLRHHRQYGQLSRSTQRSGDITQRSGDMREAKHASDTSEHSSKPKRGSLWKASNFTGTLRIFGL